MGPVGLWMPPETATFARDVSGNNRHARSSGVAFAGYHWDRLSRYPMWRTSAFANDGLVATIPAITDNSISLLARIYNDNASHRGAIIMLTNLGARGIGMGVGNGADIGVAGSTLMVLNESIAFHSSGGSFAAGWNWAGVVCATGTGTMRFFLNGAFVAATNLANMSAGTVTEAHIGGYSVANRATDYGVGHTAYFDRLLTDGEMIHLMNCNVGERLNALAM